MRLLCIGLMALAATVAGCGDEAVQGPVSQVPADAQADGLSLDAGADSSAADAGWDIGAEAGLEAAVDSAADAPEPGLVWPNAQSRANSDPWLAAHHAELREMHPKLLALNFVNKRSMQEMATAMQRIIDLVAESSRYHGSTDPQAPAFLRYEIGQAVDLRDAVIPAGWPYNNSTRYPREEPKLGQWGFDYAALFTQEFADQMQIPDPQQPSHNLRLCELIDRGMVHEVWIYADADVPDASAAEILELKPHYDEQGQRIGTEMDRCAGNGCFDSMDEIPSECTRTVRIGFVNNTRGPGCFLESLSHGLERTGSGVQIPYLKPYFSAFANMELDTRYGLPMESWYSCPYGQPCLSYPDQSTVDWKLSPTASGTIQNYDPVCGNVHFAPNGRQHYDLEGPDTVLTSCETFGEKTPELRPFHAGLYAAYKQSAYDCMGPFLVWWRQNVPGLDNKALDQHGNPMLNWWPFLFY